MRATPHTDLPARLLVSGPTVLLLALSTHAPMQALLTVRKGNKKLAIYDLKITMEWQAQGAEDESPVRVL
jgi:hypothetical protein